MPFTVVSIPGIHCASCAALIEDVSAECKSIRKVTVDIKSKKVTIDHDDTFEVKKWTEQIESLDPAYNVLPLP